MSKFRLRLKLEGFELEIEGNREDASIIGRSIGEQFQGMIAPAIGVVQGNNGHAPLLQDQTMPPADGNKKKQTRRGKAGNGGAAKEPTKVIQFRHDPMKYATPNQDWTTLNKALWFLHVASNETEHKELSTGEITESFNTQFRQSKIITNSNVSRDLGKAKVQSPSLVGEDTRSSPQKWFLTDEGVKVVQKLIADTLGQNLL